MFRRVSLKTRNFCRLYSESASAGRFDARIRSGRLIVSSVAAATLLWYSSTNIIHGDALPYERVIKTRDDLAELVVGTLAWGSNK